MSYAQDLCGARRFGLAGRNVTQTEGNAKGRCKKRTGYERLFLFAAGFTSC